MRASLGVCEAGCRAMQEALQPGITENALWARLHETNIRLGGEWIETRLLSSGPRTNPWFRECSMRKIEPGDLVCFDTDLIGPYGYCSDISRSWLSSLITDRLRGPSGRYWPGSHRAKRRCRLRRPGLPPSACRTLRNWPRPGRWWSSRLF